ncbi:MAG: PrsW family glutamic-type intramembrane protease [bacterium]
MSKREIAYLIKSWREESDFSQEYIAQKINVHIDDYRKYEIGKWNIPQSILKKIVELSHLDPNEVNLEEPIERNAPKHMVGALSYEKNAPKIKITEIIAGFFNGFHRRPMDSKLYYFEKQMFHPEEVAVIAPRLYIYSFWVIFIFYLSASLIADIVLMNLTLSLAIPFSLMILMHELHQPKNVKGVHLISYFGMGGVFSIFWVYVLRVFTGYLTLPIVSELVTGFVEETAKIFIVILILRRFRVKDILTGFLVGFAVGAGFDVFETSSYGLLAFLSTMDYSIMVDEISYRSIWAIFGIGHHFWTAILGGTLVYVNPTTRINFNSVTKPLFIEMYITVILIHAAWNFTVTYFPMLYYVVLGISLLLFLRFYMVQNANYRLRKHLEIVSSISSETQETM